MKKAIALGLLAMALGSAGGAHATLVYTPMHFRTISGIRPFIDVKMNGKSYRVMVHSNAVLYAMTTHANAEAAGLSNLAKKSDFGISSQGHVSPLGRAEATLGTMQIGDDIQHKVALSVFEVPVPDMQGMLGIRWLRDRRVIMDFESYRLGMPESAHDSADEDAALIQRGYVAHKMSWDAPRNRYVVSGSVNGVPAQLGVSTVADDVLDVQYAKSAGIALGPLVDEFFGPGGTYGDEFISKKQVVIAIDGQSTAPTQPTILDYYAYNDLSRPTDPAQAVQGNLGAVFMLANQAVIDFGSETLFLPGR